MTQPLLPCLALLLHSDSRYADGMGSGTRVLSLHGITTDGQGQALLDAGRLLTDGEAATLGQALLRPEEHAGARQYPFTPPTLLRDAPRSLTWFVAPHRRTQFWRTNNGRIAIDAVLPGLIFHVVENVLCVAAYEGTDRPHARTPLFHAPVGNVHADGRVCVGNATLPTSGGYESMPGWERVLLATNFVHVNHPTCLRGGVRTEQLIAFWQRRKRYATPPAGRLMAPLADRLDEWVNALSKEAA
ncbi:hypothetical protein [Rhodanobacter sp. FW106-PBR-R2A-1-13]|uniref:hypothetical protein n=1 Tax=Rhodanobacter sp. FW106-PBR-R2A-1-13 TaxID=3454845 RepID=UPI0034E5E300